MQRPYAGLENAQACPNVVLAMGATVAKLLKTSPVIEIEMPSRHLHSHVSGSSRIGASRAAPERAMIVPAWRGIRKALAIPGRPGVRKIAEQLF